MRLPRGTCFCPSRPTNRSPFHSTHHQTSRSPAMSLGGYLLCTLREPLERFNIMTGPEPNCSRITLPKILPLVVNKDDASRESRNRSFDCRRFFACPAAAHEPHAAAQHRQIVVLTSTAASQHLARCAVTINIVFRAQSALLWTSPHRVKLCKPPALRRTKTLAGC